MRIAELRARFGKEKSTFRIWEPCLSFCGLVRRVEKTRPKESFCKVLFRHQRLLSLKIKFSPLSSKTFCYYSSDRVLISYSERFSYLHILNFRFCSLSLNFIGSTKVRRPHCTNPGYRTVHQRRLEQLRECHQL